VLAGTHVAVFAAGVDGVNHRWCFQLMDALNLPDTWNFQI